MTRTSLLTAAAVLALAIPAHAESPVAPQQATPSNFQQAVTVIKDWFGKDNSEDMALPPVSATQDEALQIPPQPAGVAGGTPVPPLNAIEPAAGVSDDDLQVPPPYFAPQSNNAPARATAFDKGATQSAFNDVPAAQSAADLNAISSAAGEATPTDSTKVDCEAVNKAAASEDADSVPDTALIEACQVPEGDAKAPAQPAFESAPVENPLPGTQPAAGEPPIGGAVMPGADSSAPNATSEAKKIEEKKPEAAAPKAKTEIHADKPAPAPRPAN